MPDFAHMPLEALLNPEGFDCPCGRKHVTDLKYLKIGRGALSHLPEAVRALNRTRPMLICDLNTYRAAGKRAEALLHANGIPCTTYCFPTADRLYPAEWELGSITMHFDPQCDCILAVGGGVLNDLCKMLAKATGLPQLYVGTAPSMDGFASNSGAMEVNRIKTTIYTPSPAAVICDTEIMADAPERMLWAGIGDMIAKYISVCEWRLSSLATGEYYCECVADMMRAAVRKVVGALDGVMQRDPDAVGLVTEGLVLAGMAMTFARVSRPASGLEHSFSHIWEMMALERGSQYDLHGVQVGVGSMLTFHMYDWLRTVRPTREGLEAAIAAFDENAWQANLRRVFGSGAEEFIELEKRAKKNDPGLRRQRGGMLIDCWDEVQRIIAEELPEIAPLCERLRQTGMPMKPADLHISNRDALDAFYCARDTRDRYMSTSMLFDVGLLEDAYREMQHLLS